MRNCRRFCLVPVAMVVTVLFFASVGTAQDEPLPSKTATQSPADPTPEANISENQPTVSIEEPFIQSDLSILSGNVQRPNGLFWHNGMVYASCSGDWTIYEINADDGATITYLWGIRNAHTLHVEDDENGDLNLWVPDYQTGSLMRIYQGALLTVAQNLEGPWGIVAMGDSFLVTSLLDNRLLHITREGEISNWVTNFRSPTGITLHNNYVYVANNGSSRRAIEWFSLDDVADPERAIDAVEGGMVQSLVSGLQSVTGLTMGADEYLYIAYSLGTRGVVGRVDPIMCQEQGGCTNNDVEIVVYTDLAAPLSGLTLSPDMRLYLHTIFSPDIYYVDLIESAVNET